MKNADQSIRDIQHFGEEGGVVPVIDVAATSTFLNPTDMDRTFRGEMEGCYLYSRHSNPTVIAFGKKLAAMEGMEAAVGVASGMAAISSAIEQLMPTGGHVVSSRTVYGGTYAFFSNLLPRRGIQTTFVDMTDLKAVESAITPETKVIYTESVSNPLLTVSDLAKLGELARRHKLKFVVDNTFTPLSIAPVQYGADVVVYSCTKYISGSSDLIAGAIVGSHEFIAQLIDVNYGVVMLCGPVMDPRVAHELYMRLDHLPLRMRAHARSAQYFSEKIESEGIRVVYPGLKSHPHHALIRTMIRPDYGFGGMVVADCGSGELAVKLATKLQNEKFGLYAVSLGFSRTLMSCPATSTSSEVPTEEQQKMGLTPGLLRLSIGYSGEDATMTERFLKCYREVVGTKP